MAHATKPIYTVVFHIRSKNLEPLVVNLCLKQMWHIRNVEKYPIHWLCDEGNPKPSPISSKKSRVEVSSSVSDFTNLLDATG